MVIPLVSLTHLLHAPDGYVELDTNFLQFLCHMTSDVKFSANAFLCALGQIFSKCFFQQVSIFIGKRQ